MRQRSPVLARTFSLDARSQDDWLRLHLSHLLLELLLLRLLRLGGAGAARGAAGGGGGGASALTRATRALLALGLCAGTDHQLGGAGADCLRVGAAAQLDALHRGRRGNRGLGDANLGLLAVAGVVVGVLLDGGRGDLGAMHLERGNQRQRESVVWLHRDMIDDQMRRTSFLRDGHLLGGLHQDLALLRQRLQLRLI